MKVCFAQPVCKTGVICPLIKTNICSMAQHDTTGNIALGHCYEVVATFDIDNVEYYELYGWGSLKFNALCFKLEAQKSGT